MSNPRILVIEDELAHRLVIEKALRDHYRLLFVESYNRAKELIHSEIYDLVLLDIMLDESDGYQLCADIKNSPSLAQKPIIFLSSRAEVNSKVLGFHLGADDYIVKPCDPLELRARVSSKIRRNQEMHNGPQNFMVADWNFRWDRQTLEFSGEAQPVELTPLEFKLLFYLARHQDQPISRDQILLEVWGAGTHVLERTVDTFVAAIRKKLGARGKAVRSVHGVGYKFQLSDEPRRQVS